jgi:ABC-2 type transport system permease protein/sodium transport system permease protein
VADDAARSLGAGRRLRHWGRLAQKELREILRDRRTIVTLVMMPMLVYPLIGVTFQRFLSSQLTNKPRVEYRLGFRTAQDGLRMQQILRQADAFAARLSGKAYDPHREPEGTEDDPVLRLAISDDPSATMDAEALVRDHAVDVGVLLELRDHQAKLEFVMDEGSVIGRNARRHLEDRLRILNDAYYERALKEAGEEVRPPVTVTARTIRAEGTPAFSLAVLVPLILILMTVTGAVYPAIDLTAGERERGTLEALISAPVRREELLLAKYVAVLAVAILTAIANLTAMTATAYAAGLEALLFGRGGLSLELMAKVFGVLVVFASFFSSILLAVTSFARSFKEAQAYLIPVMLVSISPGVLALMPGLTLTWSLAPAPLANMVLLTSDLFEGRLDPGPAALALACTLGYTATGLVMASKIFGTDAVLYGSSGGWSDAWRRPATRHLRPTFGQAWGCLAVVLPAFLVLKGLLQGWAGTSLSLWIVGVVALTTFLFAVIPGAMAVWERIPLGAAFQWRSASWTAFLAAGLAGLALWPFAYEALVYLLPTQSLKRLMEQFGELETRVASIPYGLRLAALAAAPAITEELFFRGFFQQGLQREWGRWPAILVSGAVFGAFHVFAEGLSFERFVPSTLLGWCLGWVCLRSGSVLPGMLLHVLHNGLLLTVSEYADSLQRFGIGREEQTHLPAGWLAAAAATDFVAWALLMRTRPREHQVVDENL